MPRSHDSQVTLAFEGPWASCHTAVAKGPQGARDRLGNRGPPGGLNGTEANERTDRLGRPDRRQRGGLLDRLYAADLPPQQRHDFAVSVLLNGTLSVLEAARKEAPGQNRTYLNLAVLMLNDD